MVQLYSNGFNPNSQGLYGLDWQPALLSKMEELIKEIESLKVKVSTLSKSSEKKLLTRKETANLCGNVSMTTLHYWHKKGKLVPTKKAGRKPLYLKSDVEQFLENKNCI